MGLTCSPACLALGLSIQFELLPLEENLGHSFLQRKDSQHLAERPICCEKVLRELIDCSWGQPMLTSYLPQYSARAACFGSEVQKKNWVWSVAVGTCKLASQANGEEVSTPRGPVRAVDTFGSMHLHAGKTLYTVSLV